MKPTVLFLFNSSRYALEPWVQDGRFNVVSVDYHDTDHSEAHREPLEEGNPGWAKLGGKSARTKYIRSLTPRGWAAAVHFWNAEEVYKSAQKSNNSGQLGKKVVDKAFLKAILRAPRSSLDVLI